MRRGSSILLCLLMLLLVSCSTQIQMTCLAPSRTGLLQGSTLTIQHEETVTARQVGRKLASELQESGFYTIGADGEYLLTLDKVNENTWTTSSDKEEMGINDSETDISASVLLSRKDSGKSIFAGSYSQNTDGDWGDIDGLCRDICKDLCPHRVTYSAKLNPPTGNPFFEQAVECCQAGQWEASAPLARKAVALQPAEQETHYLLGLIERELGHYKASSECFRQAQRADAVWYNSVMEAGEAQALKQLRLPPTDRSWKHDPRLHSFRMHTEMPFSEFLLRAILQTASPVPLPF